jgi:hypothetical protein
VLYYVYFVLPKGKVVDVVLSEYLHPCAGEVSAQLLYQRIQAVLQAPHCPIFCPKVKTGFFTCVHMKTPDQLPSQLCTRIIFSPFDTVILLGSHAEHQR